MSTKAVSSAPKEGAETARLGSKAILTLEAGSGGVNLTGDPGVDIEGLF